MKKYINKKLYTDVESYLVTDIDEVKGTAMAVEVEKRITPKTVPGSFAGHCLDLDRAFDAAEPVIKEGANPFKITRNKDGVWGFKCEVFYAHHVACFTEDGKQQMIATGWEIKGDLFIKYELTKAGKHKTTFEKLGVLSDTCRYFYDYNF